MWLVYYVSVWAQMGTFVTDWTNDVLFGEMIPPAVESFLVSINCAGWLQSLILTVLLQVWARFFDLFLRCWCFFLFLAFLEGCGYMARVAFIMDRISVIRSFRKIFYSYADRYSSRYSGVMASRTIENDRDRKMTIMTTTFIPCGAKLPNYRPDRRRYFRRRFLGGSKRIFCWNCSSYLLGIILKKTKMFAGDPAPFVMELPAYHMPTIGSVLRSMWERGWSFIKKAGTIILLSTILLWFLMSFGWVNGSFTMLEPEQLDSSILAMVGGVIAPLFAPLGWGDWKMSVAAVTGLIAKENVVGTFGVLFGFAEVAENGAEIWGQLAGSMTAAAGYSFLVFNLLCAPCFAAMGAIETGDEQCPVVLVCHWISVSACLCGFSVCVPDRYPDHRWKFRNLYCSSVCADPGIYLSPVQTVQREQNFRYECQRCQS